MSARRHVVVLGGGSTGQAFVAALRRRDQQARITLAEQHLVGGECSYYACMPSKTLLRPYEAIAAAKRAPGAAAAVTAAPDPTEVFAWRDLVAGPDDRSQERWLADQGTELVRATGRVLSPGRVEAGGETIAYDELVIATGSLPVLPPIPGLDRVDYWTSREATTTSAVPESLLVLGGGPVGCELAQLYRRAGTAVTLITVAPRLLPREDAQASALLAETLAEEGVELRLAAELQRVEPGVAVELGDGTRLRAEQLLLASGRRPNVSGLGLEQLDLRISKRGVEVDERLRAGERVWAIGDVTGVAMLTHVGKYQARVAAANVAGGDARADYRAIPAVTFTDPQIASVGNTSEEEGLRTASWPVENVSRLSTYERPKRRGLLKLFADPKSQRLVGAVAVGPEAGEWLGQLTLAVRAEVPLALLAETIQPYPTFSEAVFFAARELVS